MFYSVSLQQILSRLKSIRISFCCFWPHVLIGKKCPTSTWSRNSKCLALDRWSCLHMFPAAGNTLHPWPAVPLLVNCRYYKAFSLTEVSVVCLISTSILLFAGFQNSPQGNWYFLDIVTLYIYVVFLGPSLLFLDSRESWHRPGHHFP